MARRFVGRGVLAAVVLCVVFAGVCASASAAASPWWRLESGSRPANLEEKGVLVVTAANLGDANANGESDPVSIVDKLPAGLKATAIEAISGEGESGLSGNRGPVTCVLKTLTCTFAGTLPPFDQIEVSIHVTVEGEPAPGEVNEVSVFGGEARGASLRRAVRIGPEPTFGVEDYELTPEEEGGAPATQAGSHPFQVTGSVSLNQNASSEPVALTKELNGLLPPGLIGNPTPFAQCKLGDFLNLTGTFSNECPEQTAVGVAMVTVNEVGIIKSILTFTVPIFNVEPSVGEPARFGFDASGFPVLLDASVRTGGDYGVTLSSTNITQAAALLAFKLTFWGVPGDPRHDSARGIGCIEKAREESVSAGSPCTPTEERNPPPLLSLPTSCTGPLVTSIEAASWQEPHHVLTTPGEPMQATDGCNRLPFGASISVAPDGRAGSTPTGLTVGVHVPQDEALNANGLAPSNVKDTTVALPAGVALNPASADGLQSCSESQIELNGKEPPTCPDASKVGTVEVKTPLLPNPLTGAAYVAAQTANPFGSLVALYVFVEDPASGSRVKLAGEVKPDPVTGQLVSTFLNTPQLPFEDFKLHFFGGERAPLSTPSACGAYTTTASISPWSGNAPASASSTFTIVSGPNGSPCAEPLPFAPELTGGSTNIQAGAFTPFTTTFSRQDGQQALQGIQLHMPPGVSGLLSGVELCGEAQANAGTCGPGSLIGETIVSVGAGGAPFSVKGGRVYITGPYEGAPFGLSIVNPAKAGPFDLENTPLHHPACDCLVVRAKINVDQINASLTVTTDNTGPYSIPTILEGIPLQIKHVNVTITRPGFTFNPTNCDPMQITGAIQSAQGATSPVVVPFQVTNCATLAFKPSFKVATSGKTSRKNGASLHVKLTYPKAAFGSQANIHSVKVDLPKQLPSRLSTLQKACASATFQANPASCPAASIVGQAIAITPLIPVPLAGPAYFVSYGGAKFPELVIVLQGYGVTLDLHGETFINEKTGITSSTFHTVPDAPVGSFELTLPEGKFSALAANTNLCTVKGGLKMPTIFTAQNGMVLKQSTPIAVTNCATHKKNKKVKKARRTNHGKASGRRARR